MIRLLLPFLLFCMLIAPTPAKALTFFQDSERPLTWTVDDVFVAEWHRQHEFEGGPLVLKDDFVKLKNILQTDLRWNRFQAGMRLELLYYPDPLVQERLRRVVPQPQDAPVLFHQPASSNDYRFEKYYLVYDGDNLRVDLGDYYVTFGRGLALAMRKEGEGEIDNTLRGAKIEFRYQDTTATALVGLTNTINVDPTHEWPQEDPYDLIAGVRLEQRLFDTLSLGLHLVDTHFALLESDDTRRFVGENQATILGMSIDVPDILGYASFYLEGNQIRREGREVTESLNDFRYVSDTGTGVYGSFSAYVENFVLTAEYKRYDDFFFRRGRAPLGYILEDGQEIPEGLDFFEDVYYHNLPTLERTDIETNRVYGNDQGFRLRAEYNAVSTGTQPYAVLYYTVNDTSEQGTTNLGGFGSPDAERQGDRIWHGYAGLTQAIGEVELFVDAGFRDEWSLDDKQELLELIHVKAGVSAPVVHGHVLGFEGFYLRKDYQLLKQLEDDLDLTFSYTFVNWFSASLLYTFQSKDFLPSAGDDESNHFVAGEITSAFSDIVEISIFGGQVRESVRCYGGFCRRVPPFEGVKGKVRVRF